MEYCLNKVTDFSTINQYLLYMQKLAEEVNMPYVNVTLDVGAAVNAYKLCWNYPERFKMSSFIWVTFISSKRILMLLGK